MYKVTVSPAMVYRLGTAAPTKRQEAELEVAELKMLIFLLGITRMDNIRTVYIRGTAHVGRFGEKVREARLRWFGHVLRKDAGYIGRRILTMELPRKRKRGRPVYVCGDREYNDGRRGSRLETKNPLWRPLTGAAERRIR